MRASIAARAACAGCQVEARTLGIGSRTVRRHVRRTGRFRAVSAPQSSPSCHSSTTPAVCSRAGPGISEAGIRPPRRLSSARRLAMPWTGLSTYWPFFPVGAPAGHGSRRAAAPGVTRCDGRRTIAHASDTGFARRWNTRGPRTTEARRPGTFCLLPTGRSSPNCPRSPGSAGSNNCRPGEALRSTGDLTSRVAG